MYYLIDVERTIEFGKITYWKFDNWGYTEHKDMARRFTLEDALKKINEPCSNLAMVTAGD